MNMAKDAALLERTTAIVSAFVSNNTVQKEALAALIGDTFRSLAQLGRVETRAEDLRPAVPIKRSVLPDHIICLEDGKKFKSLKRHLRSSYGMTPQAYREKWGLPVDYPMVAPNYTQTRSELAKKLGLGRLRGTVFVQQAKTVAKSAKKTPVIIKKPAKQSAVAA